MNNQTMNKKPINTFEPAIWGPHFWFFIHTLAIEYPHHPNAITKKKYYDFITSLPLFIPVEKMGKDFEKMLDDYPVTAYLDNRESLVKWTHFIHNKINDKLEKPTITLDEFYKHYYETYKPKELTFGEFYKWKKTATYIVIIVSLSCLCVYLYRK